MKIDFGIRDFLEEYFELYSITFSSYYFKDKNYKIIFTPNENNRLEITNLKTHDYEYIHVTTIMKAFKLYEFIKKIKGVINEYS